tara:strand:+ start:424 stop:927 length:504 start_codon:yes stop_codon:yes gene_type:complete
MATALFATPLDLKQNSVLSGDLDDNKVTYVIKNSQMIHVQNYLGTDLYNRLQDGAKNDNLTADELALIEDYIKPMLIWWSLAEFVSVGAYTISNKGILKHTDDTAETVSANEIEKLSLAYEKKAQHFTQRFIDYMCEFPNLYPQYNTNSGSDQDPLDSSNYGGLYLD